MRVEIAAQKLDHFMRTVPLVKFRKGERITLESTTKIVALNGINCRVQELVGAGAGSGTGERKGKK